MSAESLVTQVINNAQEIANENSDLAAGFAATAAGAVHILNTNALSRPTRPSVTIPPFDPSSDTLNLSRDLLEGYDDAVADLDPDFVEQVEDFIERYFPEVAACLKTRIDNWICDTIANGGTGFNPDVENALYERSRAREVLDARRGTDEVINGYAARGWSMPSGILIDGVQRVQQGLSDKVSTHGRDVLIKQMDIEIENIRFAVEQGIRLRLGAIDALVAFLRAWMSVRELALEKAKAIVESRVRLYSAIGEYYRAIIGAAQLYLEYDKIRIDSEAKELELFVTNAIASYEAHVKGAVAAAEAVGQIASAALGAQNTLAEIAHQTQVSAES